MPDFLIADDSPHKIHLLRGMLERAKWNGPIHIAATTEDAKKIIDTHSISAAFIDYYFPSENGPTVIAYLKKKNPAAHIALVSSGDSDRNTAEAVEAGSETAICTSWQADRVESELLSLLAEWQTR